MPIRGKKKVLTEHSEQSKTVALFSTFYPKEALHLAAVPNGGYRNALEAIHLKREGVKAGMPDLLLLLPIGKYHGMALEMKKTANGVVSKAQKDMLNRLAIAGYYTAVAYGHKEAYQLLVDYVESRIDYAR